MGDTRYWLGFNRVAGIGPAKLRLLLARFDSVEAAWHAPAAALAQAGLDRRSIANLEAARSTLDLTALCDATDAAGVAVWHWDAPSYPAPLAEIDHPPPVLFARGAWLPQDRLAVAVVGTRRMSTYGRQVTDALCAELAAHGVTIVSGLARGVDKVAHEAALNAGGRTIAVLGAGLDHIYPPEHRRLAQRIADGHGVLVTEYALGVRPEARNFPPRNRIISGLAQAVIVVEAGSRSGALITAEFALEQGRELMAVPGNVTSPLSRGPNQLIAEGARLVRSAEDVLRELDATQRAEARPVQLKMPESAEEALLYTALSHGAVHVDALCREVELPASLVSSTLTLMELKGMVQQVAPMQFALAAGRPMAATE